MSRVNSIVFCSTRSPQLGRNCQLISLKCRLRPCLAWTVLPLSRKCKARNCQNLGQSRSGDPQQIQSHRYRFRSPAAAVADAKGGCAKALGEIVAINSERLPGTLPGGDKRRMYIGRETDFCQHSWVDARGSGQFSSGLQESFQQVNKGLGGSADVAENNWTIGLRGGHTSQPLTYPWLPTSVDRIARRRWYYLGLSRR